MPLVTIFGGTGHLGQALVRAFLTGGWEVRIAARHEPGANIDGDGPSFVAADLRNDDDVARAVTTANCVVNAVSAYTERGGVSYESIRVEGAGRLAKVCAETVSTTWSTSPASAPILPWTPATSPPAVAAR